ncbi:MAG: c-type cytochrome [Chromatiales bacterium]
MAQQETQHDEDRDFASVFIMVLAGLLVISAVIFLLAMLIGKVQSAVGPAENPLELAMIEERLQPVGQVVAGPKVRGPIVQTAEQIYTNVCADCHDGGALGSPAFGVQADWGARIAQGMETLVEHAINGIGKMPARGGDDSLSDEDIQKTVQYMVDALK